MTREIISKRTTQAVIVATIGAIAGFIVSTISRVTGRNLRIIIGVVAAAAAVLLLQRYWRLAQLTEVKITATQVSELTLVVNNDAVRWRGKLYMETVTRVSTQPLVDEDGIVRDALASLYGLFEMTRDISRPAILQFPFRQPDGRVPGGHHAQPGVAAVPVEVASCLRGYEKSHPDDRNLPGRKTRTTAGELSEVQAHLVEFALGFARLAGVRDAQSTITPGNQP